MKLIILSRLMKKKIKEMEREKDLLKKIKIIDDIKKAIEIYIQNNNL